MKRETRQFVRTQIRILVTLVLVASAMVPIGNNASAQSTGNIEFLNPSSFAAGPETGIVVSDKVPENPDAGDETYRISAWVSGAVQEPAVEFELLTRQGISLEVIDDVEQVGTDTYEADWDIPDTLPDGPYTLRATLASGVLGIDNVDQPIMIQRLAERAEITYPDNRSGSGGYGMFVPLGTSANADGAAEAPKALGNTDIRYTSAAPGSGTAKVRAFYTVTDPGAEPQWLACGTESAGGAAIPSSAADNGVRCTLGSVEHLPLVTAVAVVSNTTKQGYEAALNQAGDATRVVDAYAQIPSTLDVITGATGTVDGGGCHLVEVEVADQFGREVTGANVDVHAWGPTDRLKFGTGTFDDWASVAPDRGSHASEEGIHCFAPEDDQSPVGPQGEHQVIGGPDVKHIETDPVGTDDTGTWGFQLYLPADNATTERHTTYWEVWLDETNTGSSVNSDTYDVNELCRSGLVGWDSGAATTPVPGATPSCPDQPPTEPCGGTATQTPQPCPTSPSPTPTVSPTPTPPPGDDDSITIKANDRKTQRGRRVRFSGAIDASAGCRAGREVLLQSRLSGGKFRTRVLTASAADGHWSVRKKVRRTAEWRVLARANGACGSLSSSAIKVRVTHS